MATAQTKKQNKESQKEDFSVTWSCLRGPICAHIQDRVFKEALEYLKKTDDVDGWHVMLYGA